MNVVRIAGSSAWTLILTILLVLPAEIRAETFVEIAKRGEESQSSREKIELFTRALEAWRPSDTESNKATVLSNRGNEFKRLKQYDKALADFNAANSIAPDKASYLINRCGTLALLEQFDSAISDCSRAIEISPNIAEAHFNRGQVYRKRGNFDRALKDYDRAISLDGSRAQWLSIRGHLHEELNAPAKALADYTKAIETDPRYRTVWLRRGTMFAKEGRNSEAVADFEKALRLDPSDKFALQLVVRQCEIMSDYARALSNLERIVSPSSDQVALIARMHGRMGRTKEALKHYDHALTLDSANVLGLIGRSGIYERLKKPEKEMADLERAIALSSGTAYPRFSRGSAFFLRGRLKEAESDAMKAAELEPKGPYADHLLGRLSLERGDAEAAMRHFNAAIVANPDWPPGSIGSALAASQRGEMEEARAHWKKSLELAPWLAEGLARAEREGYSFSAKEATILKALMAAFLPAKGT
ncbi:MAG: tetratricopeptide repeat protein [Elusimicrobiota bacterium]|nr:tetratricopeptide repeat protein [Elusimicrobiota bacterium]